MNRTRRSMGAVSGQGGWSGGPVTPEQGPDQVEDFAGGAVPVRALERPRPHRPAGEGTPDGLGEGGRIPGGDKDIGGILAQLRDASDAGGDVGDAAGQRLAQDV